jgi:hypothetical protein
MLLDLVEVAESHTGINLSIAINILKIFGVEEKVRLLNSYQRSLLMHFVYVFQILEITRDNASNNNSIIQYLSNTLDEFCGPANQAWCFVHTVNLIAKSILKLFKTCKAKEMQSFNNVAHALANLASDFEEEEKQEDDEDKDNLREEVDDNKLHAGLEPIKAMLLKVHLCFTLYYSKLRCVECSYAKLHSSSRTQQCSSCWHGTECCPLIISPCI